MHPVVEIVGSAWIPVALLVGVTVVLRVRNGNWLSPAPFIGLVWALYLPVSFVGIGHPPPAPGIWALVCLLMAVQFGGVLGETAQANDRNASTVHGQADLRWERRIRRGRRMLLLIGF